MPGERLGCIGLGVMGRPMALHLLRSGHSVAVWARRPESAQALLDAGAMWCATPATVARHSQIVFTMLGDGHDVEHVALGPQGLSEGLAPGSVLVDMSTIAPGTARSIAQGLAKGGVEMLDAPVSGGEQGAIAATLAIMVGGNGSVCERVRPLFEAVSYTHLDVYKRHLRYRAFASRLAAAKSGCAGADHQAEGNRRCAHRRADLLDRRCQSFGVRFAAGGACGRNRVETYQGDTRHYHPCLLYTSRCV